jgi:hypothetical protein
MIMAAVRWLQADLLHSSVLIFDALRYHNKSRKRANFQSTDYFNASNGIRFNAQ